MKDGGGIKGLDDESKGMEILMAEAFAKINPTDPLILAKTRQREENESAIHFFFLLVVCFGLIEVKKRRRYAQPWKAEPIYTDAALRQR
jgi:hypothetical protein